MTLDTRISDLTVGELLDILDGRYSVRGRSPKTVFGLDGIAELYGCSKTTAARMKKSGILDDAITQIGRKIIIDVNKALDIKTNITTNN